MSQPLPIHEFGDKQAPPIFLLHPGGAMHTVWLPLIRLWGSRYHLIAPDFVYLGGQPLALADLAAKLTAVITQQTSQPVWLVGSSMGANVALLVATNTPHLVAGLVLDSAQTGGKPPAILPITVRVLKIIMRVMMPQTWVTKLLLRQFRHYPLADQQAIRAELDATGKVAFLEQIEAHFQYDIASNLPHVAVPTLIVAGAEDMLTKAGEPHKLQTGIPHAVVKIIPQAGHVTFLKRPTLFAEVVTDFLEAHF